MKSAGKEYNVRTKIQNVRVKLQDLCTNKTVKLLTSAFATLPERRRISTPASALFIFTSHHVTMRVSIYVSRDQDFKSLATVIRQSYAQCSVYSGYSS